MVGVQALTFALDREAPVMATPAHRVEPANTAVMTSVDARITAISGQTSTA